jgi:hypothetical protein
MKRAIWLFLLCMLCYHIAHTFFWFGVSLVDPMILSVSKDMLRLLIVLYIFLLHYKQLPKFFSVWKWPVLTCIALIVWSITLSMIQWTSLWAIVVGFKYDIYPLCIVLCAIYIWHTYPEIVSYIQSKISLTSIIYYVIRILVIGLVWQWAKVLLPDVFMGLWYGPVWDYVLGQQPPIWYRTWPWWWMRLQGIFSWPNNYWFFLVTVCSLCIWLIHHAYRNQRNKDLWLRIFVAILFIVSLLWTLSRWAWIWVLAQCCLYVWCMYPRYKKYLLWWVVLVICALLIVAQKKIGSTWAHMTAWIEGISAFSQNPWGYWLASAWPSVHWAWIYLPENHYLQILLDIWLLWLVLWLWVVGSIVYTLRSSRLLFSKEQKILLLLFGFSFVGLLVEWLFLHVFEDSMVNYLFLVPCGIYIWSLCSEKGTN